MLLHVLLLMLLVMLLHCQALWVSIPKAARALQEGPWRAWLCLPQCRQALKESTHFF
jgi:hypothetical protein